MCSCHIHLVISTVSKSVPANITIHATAARLSRKIFLYSKVFVSEYNESTEYVQTLNFKRKWNLYRAWSTRTYKNRIFTYHPKMPSPTQPHLNVFTKSKPLCWPKEK